MTEYKSQGRLTRRPGDLETRRQKQKCKSEECDMGCVVPDVGYEIGNQNTRIAGSGHQDSRIPGTISNNKIQIETYRSMYNCAYAHMHMYRYGMMGGCLRSCQARNDSVKKGGEVPSSLSIIDLVSNC